MRRIKNLVATAIIATMAFSIAGCSLIAKTPEAIQKTVLAKVGTEKITLADVDAEMKADIDYLKETYGEEFESKIDDTIKEQLKTARTSILDQLVQEKILLKKAEELELVPTQEEIDEEVTSETEKLKEAYGGEEEFKSAIEYYGYTEETYKEFMETQVVAQKVKDYVVKDVVVTDEEISKYYDENISTYTKNPGANARHILFETEEDAKAAKARIDAGTSFDDIFNEYAANSSTGTKPLSEDLGFVTNDQEGYDADFLAGFKVLKEGEISEPVKSSFGYHIIEATELVTEVVITPLDEVKDSIKGTLETTKKTEVYEAKYEEWKKELDVKTYEDRL